MNKIFKYFNKIFNQLTKIIKYFTLQNQFLLLNFIAIQIC